METLVGGIQRSDITIPQRFRDTRSLLPVARCELKKRKIRGVSLRSRAKAAAAASPERSRSFARAIAHLQPAASRGKENLTSKVHSNLCECTVTAEVTILVGIDASLSDRCVAANPCSSCDAFKTARRLSRLRGCRSQTTNFPLLIETERRNRANFVVHCGSGVDKAR